MSHIIKKGVIVCKGKEENAGINWVMRAHKTKKIKIWPINTTFLTNRPMKFNRQLHFVLLNKFVYEYLYSSTRMVCTQNQNATKSEKFFLSLLMVPLSNIKISQYSLLIRNQRFFWVFFFFFFYSISIFQQQQQKKTIPILILIY